MAAIFLVEQFDPMTSLAISLLGFDLDQIVPLKYSCHRNDCCLARAVILDR